MLRVENAAAVVCSAEASDSVKVDVILAGDELLRALNAQWRHKDRPTDVLSFALEDAALAPENALLGEVYVSLDRAREQAKDYDATLLEEVARLVIHGTLHVLGYDHDASTEAREMRAREECYMRLWRRGEMP